MNLRRELARWEAARFLADRAIRARAAIAPHGSGPRILVNSLPKAGTHLLTSTLPAFGLRAAGLQLRPADLGGGRRADRRTTVDLERLRARLSSVKRGQFVSSHLQPSEELFETLEELDYQALFVIRDPRDLVVSAVDFLTDQRRHPKHKSMIELDSDAERIRRIIDGFEDPGGQGGFDALAVRLRLFEPWLSAPRTHVVRFEDLVGPAAGGDTETQEQTLVELAQAIGCPADPDLISEAMSQISAGRNSTFNKGQVGRWRERFGEEMLRHFADAVPAPLLRSYGYPPASDG